MIRMSKEEIKKRYGLREGNQEKMWRMLCMISLFDWEFPIEKTYHAKHSPHLFLIAFS